MAEKEIISYQNSFISLHFVMWSCFVEVISRTIVGLRAKHLIVTEFRAVHFASTVRMAELMASRVENSIIKVSKAKNSKQAD
jgi:hypothetical protein